MIIRQQQMDSFEQDGVRRFEDEMLAHLKSVSARHCEVIGDEKVRTAIRLGLENSKKYGFDTRGPVRFFIELMFMFGGYFDTDVQYPWASEALNSPDYPQQMFRADHLHGKMLEYLNAVSGPGDVYAKRAMRETVRLVSEAPAHAALGRSELLSRLPQVYPEKCAWLGAGRLGDVIDGGMDVARANGITAARGLGLFALLAFAMGHRFAGDPLYPWIANTLQNPLITDANARAEVVEKKSLLYLNRVLEYLERA